jgi:hypothetical protein
MPSMRNGPVESAPAGLRYETDNLPRLTQHASNSEYIALVRLLRFQDAALLVDAESDRGRLEQMLQAASGDG